jgi:(p)ppGpp synthase/HD superfamily hydrolase
MSGHIDKKTKICDKHTDTEFNSPKIDLQLIMAATKYAAECHRKQRRKDTEKTPYINHPIEVAEFLTSHGVTDRDTIIAALLHDVIEDTDGTYDDIKRLFGKAVADIVMECSDDKNLHKIIRKRLQITHASSISDSAKLVKLADKYSNVHGLLVNPPATWSQLELIGYVYWAMAVCRKLYGINRSIDKTLQDLFKKHEIDTEKSEEALQNRLEIYYKHIDKSE